MICFGGTEVVALKFLQVVILVLGVNIEGLIFFFFQGEREVFPLSDLMDVSLLVLTRDFAAYNWLPMQLR